MVLACFWPQELPVIISTRTELCIAVKRYFFNYYNFARFFKIIICYFISNLTELCLQVLRSHNYKSINERAFVEGWRLSCDLHKNLITEVITQSETKCQCVSEYMQICTEIFALEYHWDISCPHFSYHFTAYQYLHGCETDNCTCFAGITTSTI